MCRRGLAVAHAKKIVHRDLSPDNIILRNGDPADAVIIDFGIAKDANPGAETIVGNEFAGKYAYAAPEQLSGHSDARTDVYSLGALLLATYRGKAPAIGDNPMEVLKNKALPLDTSGVPEPLKSLIDRMTHPDPNKRLQSATAILEAISSPGDTAAPTGDEDGDKTVIVPRGGQPQAQTTRAKPPPDDRVAKASTGAKPRRKGGIVALILILLVLLTAGGGSYFLGYFDGLLQLRYPVADPYTLIVERKANGEAQAVGSVPSLDVLDRLTEVMAGQNGQADLSLARGAIPATWGGDILKLVDIVARLPEWALLASGNQVRVTGLTNDRAEHGRINRLLAAAMPETFVGSAIVELGPHILTEAMLAPVLERFSDCGVLRLANPPAVGYPNGARVIVSGRVAEVGTRVKLLDAIAEIAGLREVFVETEVLNPTLCLISKALPAARPGGFDIVFSQGDTGALNSTGRYFVGENPVIDIAIPADLTSGFLFVAALDVSGNVFHLLPNLNNSDNSIEALRGGKTGPVSIRVAYSLAESAEADGKKLAFVVEDTALGKTQILVIHADTQIFDGMRPTTESAASFANLLQTRTEPVRSLDSRILTTAQP